METQNDGLEKSPTKEVGTGFRGRDQQAMRWFGKGKLPLTMAIVGINSLDF